MPVYHRHPEPANEADFKKSIHRGTPSKVTKPPHASWTVSRDLLVSIRRPKSRKGRDYISCRCRVVIENRDSRHNFHRLSAGSFQALRGGHVCLVVCDACFLRHAWRVYLWFVMPNDVSRCL